MLETLLILGNFKHPFLCSVAFIFRVHKKMTESYLVRKKTTPDLSIVKRLGGSRVAIYALFYNYKLCGNL